MRRFDIATLSIQTGTAATALGNIERYLASSSGSGNLCAVWTSDIGALNAILVIRAFNSDNDLSAERIRMLESGDLFGANDQLTGITFEAYAPFPFVEPRLAGTFGGVYEVRSYRIKSAGLRPTLAAWEAAVPARTKLSPIVLAAYALDGATPRMLHVCPYADLNERTRIRAEAVASGIWPPKGGPNWLTVMQSMICVPAKFSPLR